MDSLPLSHNGKTALDVAQLACLEAGDVLLTHFHHLSGATSKGRGNLLTQADIQAEKVIKDIIGSEFPHDGHIAEESGNKESNTGFNWIVDPLDGTSNYYFGLPHFAINVALAKGEEVLLGLTYDPLQNELFQAEKGKGAFLNGSPIRVSEAEQLKDCLVSYDMGYSDERGKEMLHVALTLWPGVHSLRLFGSVALGMAYVACGD